MQEMWFRSPAWEDLLEKEMATHSSILAWRIPWTEEPCGLQSTGSQRVGHDWAQRHTHAELETAEHAYTHCGATGQWQPPEGCLHLVQCFFSFLVMILPCLPSFLLSLSIYIFLAVPNNIWDLSSLTRDRTLVPCIGSAESYPLDHQGNSWAMFLISEAAPQSCCHSQRWILFCLSLGFLFRSQLWIQKAFTWLLCWCTPLLS